MINMETKYSRQLGIINPKNFTSPLSIIGVGSIGSWATLALSKVGCPKIKVIDFDKVEAINTATQLYSQGDIGKYKVNALASHIENLTGTEIETYPKRWEDLSDKERISEIMVVTVDSMEIRQLIWDDIRSNPDVEFLVDGRMGGELIRLFTIPLTSAEAMDYYAAKLRPKEIEPIPCSERAVAFNGFTMAGLITASVAHWAKEEVGKPEFVFDLSTFNYI